MTGLKQTVQLDSNPRGLNVHSGEGETFLGETPSFVRISRARNLKLKFFQTEQSFDRTDAEANKLLVYDETVPCSYRWGVAGVNIAAGLTLPLLIPVFLGADIISGGAFDCPSRIIPTSAALSHQENIDVPYCRRILVVPPPRLRKDEALAAAEKWIEANSASLKGCDRFVDLQLGLASLSIVNFRFGEGFQFQNLPTSSYPEIGFASKSTHAVVLDAVSTDVGKSQISWQMFDLANLKSDQSDLALRDVGIEAESRDSFWRKWRNRFYLDRSLFFPNSLAAVFERAAQNQYIMTPKYSGKIEKITAAKGVLPKYFSSFMYTSVGHNYGHQDWTFTFDLQPSVEIMWLKYNALITKSDGQQITEDVQIQTLAPAYLLGFSFYTPIFSISYGIGPGGYFARSKLDGEAAKFTFGASVAGKFVITRFVNNQTFFQLGSENNIGIGRSIPVGRYHDLQPAFRKTYFSVGTYLPVANRIPNDS